MRRNSQLFFRAFVAVAVATGAALPVLWPILSGTNKDYDRGGLIFIVSLMAMGNVGFLAAALWAKRKESRPVKVPRIPIETANRFLATFGITKPTKDYERWVKEDGFDLDDFANVLTESPFIFVVDWRADIADELPRIVDGLAKLRVRLESKVDAVASTAFVGSGENKILVKYVPADHDDFTDTIVAIQSVVPSHIEFRKSPDNELRDTWYFAALPRAEWSELEALDSAALQRLYVPL